MSRIGKLTTASVVLILASVPFTIAAITQRPEGLPLGCALAMSAGDALFAVGVYYWGRQHEAERFGKKRAA